MFTEQIAFFLVGLRSLLDGSPSGGWSVRLGTTALDKQLLDLIGVVLSLYLSFID